MDVILGLLMRHLLTGAGAVLVTKGIADPTSAEAITGGVATAAGLAWSYWQKRKAAASK